MKKHMTDLLIGDGSPQAFFHSLGGKTILIDAGCGAGKTYFALNAVCDWVRYLQDDEVEYYPKVYIVEPRKASKLQFQEDIEDRKISDVCTAVTYQSIETRVMSNTMFDVKPYDIVVFDEAQYFVKDSKFNPNTDVSFQWAMSLNCTKFFMSATPGLIFSYIRTHATSKLVEFYIERDYSHIKKIIYFIDEKKVDKYINSVLEKGKKALYFSTRLDHMFELHKKYRNHSTFYCSKSNRNYKDVYAQYVNHEEIEEMSKTQMLPRQLLMTTTAIDTGFNIKDPDVVAVITDISDPEIIYQCINRRRFEIDVDGSIEVFVKIPYRSDLFNEMRRAEKDIEKPYYLYKNGDDAFIKKYANKIGQISESEMGNGVYYSFKEKRFVIKNMYHIQRIYDYCKCSEYWTKGAKSENTEFEKDVSMLLTGKETGTWILDDFDDEVNYRALSNTLMNMVDIPMDTKEKRESFKRIIRIHNNGHTINKREDFRSFFDLHGIQLKVDLYGKRTKHKRPPWVLRVDKTIVAWEDRGFYVL